MILSQPRRHSRGGSPADCTDATGHPSPSCRSDRSPAGISCHRPGRLRHRDPGLGRRIRGQPGRAGPATTVRVITADGMAGWQITLIALGAALVAATVAVLLDRALSARRAASATTHEAPASPAMGSPAAPGSRPGSGREPGPSRPTRRCGQPPHPPPSATTTAQSRRSKPHLVIVNGRPGPGLLRQPATHTRDPREVPCSSQPLAGTFRPQSQKSCYVSPSSRKSCTEIHSLTAVIEPLGHRERCGQ